jgi:predicted lipoprotein with Yx(FWY)xxD motif
MKKNLLILGMIVIAAACLAGCATTPPYTTPTPTPTITTTTVTTTTTAVTTTTPTTTTIPPLTAKTTSTAQLGTFLTNANGMALYYFALDVPGSGTTACNTSTCLSAWTLFNAGTISVSSSLKSSDFGTISVPGGTQTTYRGWPLYLYNGDTAAGETKGDGINDVWYVMKPDYSVVIMKNSRVGSYLADGTGKTLYNFSIDSNKMSACTNSSSVLIQGKTCLQLWPVFAYGSIMVPSALNPSDFAMFTRNDGMMQTAFKGMPLYYFLIDTSPGQTSGQGINGFGGIWYVVPPTPIVSTTTTIPRTTTVPSGGGYGY